MSKIYKKPTVLKTAPSSAKQAELVGAKSAWGITDAQAEKLINFILENPYSAIIAPTGSGKSTKVIRKLYEHDNDAVIFVTQPTVPAARNLYEEMTRQFRISNPEKRNIVGYAAEGDIKYNAVGVGGANSNTSIVYCTAGHLRRKFLSYFKEGKVPDGSIDFCTTLVLDEAHSGSLDNDIITELWIKAAESGYIVPRLILASATFSPENTVIADIPTFEITTKSFPVSIEYSGKDYTPDNKMIYTDMSMEILRRHYNNPVPENKVSKWLAFCAGKSEVDAVCDTIRRSLGASGSGTEGSEGVGNQAKLNEQSSSMKLIVLPAYSTLTPEQMQEIFKPVPEGYRLVIVATNIAEASITINGLDGVFDSLTEKVAETSSSGGFRLVTKNISKSSSNQRKGRTGRTTPGFCYRMCSERFWHKLQEQREPEISRVPLTNMIIELLNVGLNPAELFAERISSSRMKDNLKILKSLKLITDKNQVTDLGNFATVLPLGVRNSALIYNWINTKGVGGNSLPLNERSSSEEARGLPLYPMVVLAVILDSYGPSYHYYPKREDSVSVAEYNKFKEEYYTKYFEKYNIGNDIESLLKMWNVMIDNFKSLKPSYEEVLEFCKENSLNNKKIQELIKVVRECCRTLYSEFDQEIIIGPFNEKKFFRMAEPYLKNAYFDSIFIASDSDVKKGMYFNPETKDYFRLDRKQGVNIGGFSGSPSKIIAFRTAEIVGANGRTMKAISLYAPIK